jgi:hypothetical protein
MRRRPPFHAGRARGSASVEFVLILPLVAVLIAAIGFFRRGYLTELQALHAAETDTWRVAMSNDRGVCGSNARHVFSRVPLGSHGDEAREIAAGAMRELSFLYVNGGVRRSETRDIPRPLQPLGSGRWAQTTRGDYLPCNETIGADDGALPGAFQPWWMRKVMP